MHLVFPYGPQWSYAIFLSNYRMHSCEMLDHESHFRKEAGGAVSILHLLQDSSIAIIQMLISLLVHLTQRASCSTNRLQTLTKIGLHISCMNQEPPPSGYTTIGWEALGYGEPWNLKSETHVQIRNWTISLYQYPKPWGETVCLCHPSASSTLLQTNV